MVMQIQCPNPSCGKFLSVREEYAGKRVKCPTCGTEQTISEDLAKNRPTGQDQPVANAAPRALETVVQPRVLNETPRQESFRPDMRFDLRRKSPDNLLVRLALGFGVCALVLLSITPTMGWLHISRDDKVKPEDRGLFNNPLYLLEQVGAISAIIGRPGAPTTIMVCSALAAFLWLLALGVAQTPQEEIQDAAITVSGGVGLAWGITVGLWQIWIAWKVMTLSRTLTEQTNKPGGLRSSTDEIWPGFGLGIGLLAAFAIVLSASYLVARRRRLAWMLTSAGLGIGLGLLIMVLSVKPWEELGK